MASPSSGCFRYSTLVVFFCPVCMRSNSRRTPTVTPGWVFKSLGSSPETKQVARVSSVCSGRLWTLFLQIHTLLFTWNLLFGWLPDLNSIIAGLLCTLQCILAFILCITSHFHTETKHPYRIPSLCTQCDSTLCSHWLGEHRQGII